MVSIRRSPRRGGSSDDEEGKQQDKSVVIKTTRSLRRFLPFGGKGSVSSRTAISSVGSLDEEDHTATTETVPCATVSNQSGTTEALLCPQHEARYLLEQGLEHSAAERDSEALESLVQALSVSQHGSELQPRILWALVGFHVKKLASSDTTEEQHSHHRTEADTYIQVLKPNMEDVPDEAIEQQASLDLLDFLQEHGQWSTALRVAQVCPPSNTVLARIQYETATSLSTSKAVPKLQEALWLCNKSDNDESSMLKESILHTMMHAHAAEEEWDDALSCHSSYMECLDSASPEERAQAHLDAAALYRAQGDHTAALESLERGLQLLDVDKDLFAVKLLQAKAHSMYQLGNTPAALRIYESLLPRVDHSPADSAKLNYTMGRICAKTGRYEQALHYFGGELKIQKKSLGKSHLEVARIHHELAQIHDECLGDYDKALKHFQKALKIEVKNAAHEQAAETKKCMGRIHYKRGDFDKALETSLNDDLV